MADRFPSLIAGTDVFTPVPGTYMVTEIATLPGMTPGSEVMDLNGQLVPISGTVTGSGIPGVPPNPIDPATGVPYSQEPLGGGMSASQIADLTC